MFSRKCLLTPRTTPRTYLYCIKRGESRMIWRFFRQHESHESHESHPTKIWKKTPLWITPQKFNIDVPKKCWLEHVSPVFKYGQKKGCYVKNFKSRISWLKFQAFKLSCQRNYKNNQGWFQGPPKMGAPYGNSMGPASHKGKLIFGGPWKSHWNNSNKIHLGKPQAKTFPYAPWDWYIYLLFMVDLYIILW